MKMKKLIYTLMILILGLVVVTACNNNSTNDCEHQFTEATCDTPKKCKICGKIEGSVLGHTLEWIIDVEPTCTIEGTKHQECTRCNKVLEHQTIEMLNHELIHHDKLEPTCTSKGHDAYDECSICDYTTYVELDKTKHQFGDWEIKTYPTYDNEGEKIRICLDCQETQIEKIDKLDPDAYLQEMIEKVIIPAETKEDLGLPTLINEVTITWQPANTKLISTTGVIKRSANNVNTSIKATFEFKGITKEVNYPITILGYTNQEKLQMAMDTIVIPQVASGDLVFNTVYSYGVRGVLESQNTKIIDNNGKVYLGSSEQTVTIKVILILEDDKMEKEFNVTVPAAESIEKSHQLIIRSNDLAISSDKLEVVDGKLVLKNNVLEASFESEVIETSPFRSLVCSWAAITNTNATVEVMVKALVDGVWSEYITYSPWGLGLQNASHDQTNNLIKLSTDEVIVLNSKKATALKYKVILKRKLASNESPKLSLVSFALEIPNYKYYVDMTNVQDSVCYDVPKLCQNVVPTIGNSICSATSTTMLLKYKGLSFTEFDSQYEHRYIAGVVKDYGNNIYGNWVYNTVTMGGYGFDAYVARMYSIDELVYHLSNVGPVALSVKGTMTSTEKTYTTNGHLIVAIGYKTVNGKLYILCNDPNVANVYCEYSVDVINTTWRKIAYVIE